MGETLAVPSLVQEAAQSIRIAREREQLREQGLLMARRITDLVTSTVPDPYPQPRKASEWMERRGDRLAIDYMFESEGTPVAVRISGSYPRPDELSGSDNWGHYVVFFIDPELAGTESETDTGFRYSVGMMGIARFNKSMDDLKVNQKEFDEFNELIQSLEAAVADGTLRVVVHSPVRPSETPRMVAQSLAS